MNAESPYSFYLDLDNGRGVTNDAPAFSVAFGARSRVIYQDPVNKIVMGAAFAARSINVDTESIVRQISSTPDLGDIDAYIRLIFQRIRAAAAWDDNTAILFRGPWGDLAAAQSRTL